MLQDSILCGCGSADLNKAGLCRRCERRARLSREYFGGLREDVLIRDGYQCQVCGELDRTLVLVHHRRPGVDLMRFLITLCRRCHTRIHHTWRPSFVFLAFELLRRLWREVNADLPEQRLLGLLSEADERAAQTGLFEDPRAL